LEKYFLHFWLITFEPIEFHEKTNNFFLDLSEMHILSKCLVNQRLLRGSKLDKINFFDVWNLSI
jgi:hypothetical protein